MTSAYTPEQWATMRSGGVLAPTIQWELAEEVFSGMYENLSDDASELEYREAAITTAQRLLASPVIARIRAEAWDEGYDVARATPTNILGDELYGRPTNPYRPTSILSESGDANE